jgi:hypothetical protein
MLYGKRNDQGLSISITYNHAPKGPTMQLSSTDKCSLLLIGIEQGFNTLFKDKRIAYREWKAVHNSVGNPPDVASLNLTVARVENYYQMTKAIWTEPVHVVFRALKYVKFASIKDALKQFTKAQKFYEQVLSENIKGNLSISCEISFDRNGPNGSKTYNVHAHVACEKQSYLKMIAKTPHWREGSGSSTHYMQSRMCSRRWQQTDADYINCVFLYNSKWTLHEGDSRVAKTGKKTVTHRTNKSTIDYAFAKTKCFIRLNKTRTNSYSKAIKSLLDNLKNLVKVFQSWSLLNTKENLIKTGETIKKITQQNIKKAPKWRLTTNTTGRETSDFSNSS